MNAALVWTYAYNALGQRVLKTYPDNTKEIFHYNEAGQLIAVTNASGTTVREYIYNGSTLIGYVNAGVITYVHNDIKAHHKSFFCAYFSFKASYITYLLARFTIVFPAVFNIVISCLNFLKAFGGGLHHIGW